FGNRAPRLAVVVAAEHADVWPPPTRPVPFTPTPVVLHVEPSGRVLVTRDLVHALAELGIGVRREARADAFIRRRECLAAVLAEIMAAGRDAEVHTVPVAQDRVHAESAVGRLPLAR